MRLCLQWAEGVRRGVFHMVLHPTLPGCKALESRHPNLIFFSSDLCRALRFPVLMIHCLISPSMLQSPPSLIFLIELTTISTYIPTFSPAC